MGFKEQVENDISGVFLNSSEFAELYEIEMGGVSADVYGVLDIDSNQEPLGNPTDGIYYVNRRFHCFGNDLPRTPAIGKAISIDGSEYLITNVSYEMGMVVMTLDVHEGY